VFAVIVFVVPLAGPLAAQAWDPPDANDSDAGRSPEALFPLTAEKVPVVVEKFNVGVAGVVSKSWTAIVVASGARGDVVA
jgi:hypothetical protein